MVNDLFDNVKGIRVEDALNMIKNYIRKNFFTAEIIKEYNEPFGYWGLNFKYKEAIIFFESDRGGLDCFLKINDLKLPLAQYDRLVSNASIASEKNIQYILSSLNRFFNQ